MSVSREDPNHTTTAPQDQKATTIEEVVDVAVIRAPKEGKIRFAAKRQTRAQFPRSQ
eukprot:m.487650 g.487650  ORF g.487650 m.487650 type:complete len:57 (+) comp85193_c0_seq1:43-213(+)